MIDFKYMRRNEIALQRLYIYFVIIFDLNHVKSITLPIVSHGRLSKVLSDDNL